MEFPALDDVRWDRLLRAVLQAQPLGLQPDAPAAPDLLATPFPSPPPRSDTAQRALAREGLDAYA